ncbi:metallophosphatase family protein [Thalassococcus sp. CAU 1522]|uniref:Metallophosphatase family protein n=1 Tax=Thalassococcus arenae TaxID=2851652 RepID=A0ABS6NBB5_9RHOB|nr:metallophosphoesterase family protein [Thalassococcus arenae]MBV2360825.1 metallophosphatase family protein [Thalassococcus arenae]
MRIAELGAVADRALVFGGVYSNRQALAALRARAGALGVGRGDVVCTGDVVAYGADPLGCVAAMRDWDVACIAGNVEKQLGTGAGDCGCGFAEGTVCDRLSAGWFGFADAACGAAQRGWMAALPDLVRFDWRGRRCVALHGGVSDVARFLWPASPEAEFLEELSLVRSLCGDIDVVFAGHCGVAFQRAIDGVLWVNAGAIGLPPDDGRAQTRFALLHGDGRITLERLDYDHRAARAAMVAAGLVQGYHDALVSGRWPSSDVLPPVMRNQSRASG